MACSSLQLLSCQVLTQEIVGVRAQSSHPVVVEILTMGMHELEASMRLHLQERIDALDREGIDEILLRYALCGKGTEGMRAGKTQLVLPRAHDCIGILMGSRHDYQAYFETHPGFYFRSSGWIEYQTPGQSLEPANTTAKNKIGERSSREELIAQYGEGTIFSSSSTRIAGITRV